MPSQAAPLRSGTSLRDAARYLAALRPIVADALAHRSAWIRQLGIMLDQTRAGSGLLVADAAGRIGRSHVELFRDCRARAALVPAPPELARCRDAALAWLEKLIVACEALVAVGDERQLRRLRDAQDAIADARLHAREFNDHYTRAAADLRRRAQARRPAPRPASTPNSRTRRR